MSFALAFVLGPDVARHARLPPLLGRLGPGGLYGELSVPLHIGQRVIMAGWAFRAGSLQPCTVLGDDDIAALLASNGVSAIDRLWGNFLLFWQGHDGVISLLRSAVTGPAVYLHNADAGQENESSFCAFTDLTLARRLGYKLAGLDAAALDAELRYPLLRKPQTGLSGVRELLPGQIVRVEKTLQVETGWTPWRFQSDRPARPSPEALRHLVGDVIRAWAHRFDTVQLELSGGLDSAIVAAALAPCDLRWRAVTFATRDADGDERRYAQAAAAAARVPLHVLLTDNDRADPHSPPRRLRARPGGFGLLAMLDAELAATTAEFGADAMFTGAGGDNVFGYLTSAAPVVDAFRFAGARTAVRAARDLASMMNDSLWRALRLALDQALRSRPPWRVDTGFLTQRFAAQPVTHPWFDGMGRVAPGQRAYALKLLPIMPYLDGYDRALARPMIAPLLSQPIVEFGLAVASWHWCAGGQDRALARRAFAGQVPELILARRSKGRIESLIYPVFRRHRRQIHDFLREGWLASEGVLDCEQLTRLLDADDRTSSAAVMRIFHIVDTERWARSILASA